MIHLQVSLVWSNTVLLGLKKLIKLYPVIDYCVIGDLIS